MVKLSRGDFIMMQKYFENITDSRQQGKIQYNLLEIIIITIIAVVAGAEHWNEIVLYCKTKENWFKSTMGLKLTNGIPTDDTFSRIFAIINPKELEKCFIEWVQSIHTVTQGEVVSIDGKTLRGSRNDNKSVIHMVSAWSNKAQMVLGQLRVDEKSNEIPAVPELLDLLELNGCIITSDAMSCQKKTVKKITAKNCDYVICLKGNQELLHEDVKQYFESAAKDPKFFPAMKVRVTEKGHGRIEKRCYYLTTDVNWIEDKNEWANLNAIGMVHSIRIVNGIETCENRYFISSVIDIKSFAYAVRTHWGIENSLHWCLDTTLHEDECRVRADNSGENLAVIRHIATNLYKSYAIPKLSMKAKRFRCSFDDAFLWNVIFNKF